jgi:hypothetical protein
VWTVHLHTCILFFCKPQVTGRSNGITLCTFSAVNQGVWMHLIAKLEIMCNWLLQPLAGCLPNLFPKRTSTSYSKAGISTKSGHFVAWMPACFYLHINHFWVHANNTRNRRNANACASHNSLIFPCMDTLGCYMRVGNDETWIIQLIHLEMMTG